MLISIVPHATRTILVPQEIGEQASDGACALPSPISGSRYRKMPPKRKANAEAAGDAASRTVKRRIVKWEPSVVAAYLEAQGVEAAVAAKIENEKISGKSLSSLTDKKLKSVGLNALGERESVLEAASYLKDPLFGKYLEWGYDKDEDKDFAVTPEKRTRCT